MARRQSDLQPGWASVKAKLASFDRTALLGLVQDLYVAHKDNQAFLHARIGLGKNVLEPYMKTIDRGLWPDVSRRQYTSVLKAKQAIADYKKALFKTSTLLTRTIRHFSMPALAWARMFWSHT
jgi:hypothetical protein